MKAQIRILKFNTFLSKFDATMAVLAVLLPTALDIFAHKATENIINSYLIIVLSELN